MKTYFLICLLLATSMLLYAWRDSLEETCKKATKSKENYEFCMTNLQVVPGSRTADVYNLTVMLTELVKTNYTYVYNKYEELSKQSGWSNWTRKSFQVCLGVYGSSSIHVDKAINMAKTKDYHELGMIMTSLHADADTCEETFEEGGEKSPIPKVDDDFANLADLAVAFSDLCQKN